MIFSRNLDQELLQWWGRPERKALILRGARQTGKSTAVRQLGTKASLFLELNLERFEDLALVRSCHSAEQLLQRLQQHHNLLAIPPGSLLFLDEIQEHPQAMRWLRFFHEDYPELGVVAAGSLLEVRLRKETLPFPVGRVEFLRAEPLTFLEFLDATRGDRLHRDLLAQYRESGSIEAGLHELAMSRFRTFLQVGGMPEAVATWHRTGNLVAVGEILDSLQQAYLEDLPRYGSSTGTVVNLQMVLTGIPALVGRRFKQREVIHGMKDHAVREALQLLELAMILYRVVPTASLRQPVQPRPKAAHKLLPLDIGMALRQLGLRTEDLERKPIEKILDGRIAEAFVGLQLLARNPRASRRLSFWAREGAGAQRAEVDYLVPHAGNMIPVEVKAGATGSLRSLHQFLALSGDSCGIRLCSARGGIEQLQVTLPQGGSLRYELHSLPLYLAELVGLDVIGL